MPNCLYRIYYDIGLAYIGRTRQPITSRLRGHFFCRPMHRALEIEAVTRIEIAELPTVADMYLYEIYYINKDKPLLNCDDKAKDDLTVSLPELDWHEHRPARWSAWLEETREKARVEAEWTARFATGP